MSLRRTLVTLLAVAGVLLLAAVLYLAFGDLSRHKPSLESLVSESLGRPFAIDGPFELELLPAIRVRAERVRLGNAPWGTAPQMVEVGQFSAKVGLWSLVSGPVDIRSLELRDVVVVLEKDADGKANWAFGEQEAGEDAGPGDAALDEVPAVVLHARLANLRVAYREPGKPEHVARLETLTIDAGADGLIALAGQGSLDQHPATLKGEVGPLAALVSGRDLRVAMQAGLGELRLELKGALGRLDPLDGADLALKVAHPDLAALLKQAGAPAFAKGALDVAASLKDAGERTRLEVDAKAGDLSARVDGTLRTLGLRGADLRFEASLPDAARVATAFGAAGVPAGALKAGGRIRATDKEIELEDLSARLADAKATAEGTIRTQGERQASLRLALDAASLAKLRTGLPAIPLAMNANLAASRAKLELKDVKGHLGEGAYSGHAAATLSGRRRIDAELASPVLDLTPFLPRDTQGKPEPKQPAQEKFVFGEEPLPLDALKDVNARLRVSVGELKFDTGALKEVDAVLSAAEGKVALEARARGGVSGHLQGEMTLAPQGKGAAALDLKLAASELRAGLSAGQGIERGEVPALRMDADLRAAGSSARQLAAGANGRLLVALGTGKVKSGIAGLIGGDLLGELAGKLNPFSAQDPYTGLDCVVARVEVVDGLATVEPVLMQSRKVTVVASGKVDLRTERLQLDFNTRPREGVGISAGMFTNPFVQVAGTLASPRLGVRATGTAAAAATGGMTVLAQGLWDRLRGEQDLCKPTLEAASAASK